MRHSLCTSVCAAVVGAALFAQPALAAGDNNSKATEEFGHEVAFEWMELLYDVVKNEATPPPPASRIYGIAAVTLHESVVPSSKYNRSLVGQLNDLSSLPAADKKKLYVPAVANAAMASVIRGLYPAAKQSSRDMIDALEAELGAAYLGETSKKVYDKSVAHGEAVAAAILDWSATDGFDTYSNCAFTPPVGPGLWEPTPPAFAAPAFPCWGQIRTMVLESSDECLAGPPPSYSEDPSSDFYALALEVYETDLNLTQEQMDIANYWADGPGATGTPPGHSIGMMGDFVLMDNLDLMAAAEGYARVGMAVHDAFIGCWRGKYLYNFLRPITAINDLIDPTWTPLLTTPNFPEHTSGHSTQSGATEQVVLDFVGGDRTFTDTTRSRHGLLPVLADRTLTVIGAAEEAAVSRLYGGIHYSTGNNDGLAQGRCIGQTLVTRIDFTK